MAVYSMTAYGHGEATTESHTYQCEIKTLNSRFLEVNLRLPRSLLTLETELVAYIKSKLERGKVDCFFEIKSKADDGPLPSISMTAVRHYLELAAQITATASNQTPPAPLTCADLLNLEGVLDSRRHSIEQKEQVARHRQGLTEALAQAIAAVKTNRQSEGQALVSALRSLITELSTSRQAIAAHDKEIRNQLTTHYVTRIEHLVKELADKGIYAGSDIVRDRLTGEIALYADKIDIAEELTRLAAHEQEFSKLLDGHGAIGRKLDFLCQEMHREVNTISNKLVQIEVSRLSVAMKQTVERLKQQVQNIE